MTYLLDTNAWAAYLNNSSAGVVRRIVAQPAEVVLCSVVKAELYYGAFHGTRAAANLALLDNLFRRFDSLPFDDAAAEVCGRVRATLARQGTPIGPNDVMIAAIALVHDAVVVT